MNNLLIVLNSMIVLHSDLISQSGPSMQNEGFNASKMSVPVACYDVGNLSIATVACIVAVITCVFTILMYQYVKKQLELAKAQLEKQWETNEINEIARQEYVAKATQYVWQVKNLILNNTMVDLVEKKQQLLQDYDYLYGYLIKNPDVLKKGKVYLNVNELRKTIDNLAVRLDSILDIIGLFISHSDSLTNCYIKTSNSIKDLKNKDIIAHNMIEEDDWLNQFYENRKDLIIEVENAIEHIKNDIKSQIL